MADNTKKKKTRKLPIENPQPFTEAVETSKAKKKEEASREAFSQGIEGRTPEAVDKAIQSGDVMNSILTGPEAREALKNRKGGNAGAVFRDEDNDLVEGATTPRGTFFGLDREETAKLLQQQATILGGAGGGLGGLPTAARFGGAGGIGGVAQERFDLQQKGALDSVDVTKTTDLNNSLEQTGGVAPVFNALSFAGKINFIKAMKGKKKLTAAQKELLEKFTDEIERLGIEELGDDATERELFLNEIRKKAYKDAKQDVSLLGAQIEAIPVIGDLVSSYAGDLIKDPKGEAFNTYNKVKGSAEKLSEFGEKTRNGGMDPDQALDIAQQYEEQIADAEGRLKLLISASPALRNNPEFVNEMENELQTARVKVNQLRNIASIELTARATGTREIAPDQQLWSLLASLE